MKRGQGFDTTIPHFYEAPMEDPDYLEVWCYTQALSFEGGETVDFHLNTTASKLSLEILRDGGEQVSIHQVDEITGNHYPTPDNFYEVGCGWPIGYSWQIPNDLASGFYLVLCKVVNDQGETREHEAGFFVRPKVGKPSANILLIAATSTWSAYNDWGGTSSYVGLSDEFVSGKSPRLSIHRPWAKGFLSVPGGAPRKTHEYKVRPGDIPRYPPIEFACTRGYSKYYASAGWATYEQPFVQWAEQQGFTLDYACQHDLHYRPELLDAYPCVVTVGHDEYWSQEMRVAIDHYIEQGGHLARFGANLAWQIRLEEEGTVQVCYKEDAPEKDPVSNTENKALLTAFWEGPQLGWNGAETMGLNALRGLFANVGHLAPRQGGGFTVYRPEHWALQGTDLCYGDQFGGEANIFGYEVDGLDYVIRDGIPEPTYKDGAMPGTEIIAMGLASNAEVKHGNKGSAYFYGDTGLSFEDMGWMAKIRYGEDSDEARAAAARGNGMMISCKRGEGQIFAAGSCEWVAGLKLNDTDTTIITRNVLEQFCRGL